MKLKAPISEAALAQALEQEGVEPPYDEWMSAAIDGIHSRLETNPSLYKTYGPMWYRIKAMLNGYGYSYGDDFEGEIGGLYTADHFVLAAGIITSNSRVQSGMSTNNLFQLLDEEGEVFEFTIEDPDMQNLIFERGGI